MGQEPLQRAEVFAAAEPVLPCIAKTVYHLGDDDASVAGMIAQVTGLDLPAMANP